MPWNLIFIVAGVLGLAGLIYLGVLYIAARMSIYPFRVPHWIAPGEMGYPQENVEFKSGDLTLRGWWSEGDPDIVAIFAHGYIMNRSEFVPILRALEPRPTSLFFDFRAHGNSQGRKVTVGPAEAEDVQAALDWVRARRPNARIVFFGSSMGAAAGVLALQDEPENVDALILDSMYGTLDEAARNWWSFIMSPQAAKWLRPTHRIGRILTGFDPATIRPGDALATFKDKPILLLAGGRDPIVPKETAERMVANAGDKAEVVWFERSSHGRGRLDEPNRYHEAIADFYRRRVVGRDGTDPPSVP